MLADLRSLAVDADVIPGADALSSIISETQIDVEDVTRAATMMRERKRLMDDFHAAEVKRVAEERRRITEKYTADLARCVVEEKKDEYRMVDAEISVNEAKLENLRRNIRVLRRQMARFRSGEQCPEMGIYQNITIIPEIWAIVVEYVAFPDDMELNSLMRFHWDTPYVVDMYLECPDKVSAVLHINDPIEQESRMNGFLPRELGYELAPERLQILYNVIHDDPYHAPITRLKVLARVVGIIDPLPPHVDVEELLIHQVDRQLWHDYSYESIYVLMLIAAQMNLGLLLVYCLAKNGSSMVTQMTQTLQSNWASIGIGPYPNCSTIDVLARMIILHCTYDDIMVIFDRRHLLELPRTMLLYRTAVDRVIRDQHSTRILGYVASKLDLMCVERHAYHHDDRKGVSSHMMIGHANDPIVLAWLLESICYGCLQYVFDRILFANYVDKDGKIQMYPNTFVLTEGYSAIERDRYTHESPAYYRNMLQTLMKHGMQVNIQQTRLPTMWLLRAAKPRVPDETLNKWRENACMYSEGYVDRVLAYTNKYQLK